jgi:hypothetical protein
MKQGVDKMIEGIADLYCQEHGHRDAKGTGRIQDRKMIIGIHNGWTLVSGGSFSELILKPTREGNLESSSNITVNDIYNDPNCAIIFELEYTMIVTRPGFNAEHMKLTLCWTPFVPSFSGSAI